MPNTFITAGQIHNGTGWLPAGTIIELTEDGTVAALHAEDRGYDVQHYEGVITPGFVNAHCHLELSHLKGVVPEASSLIPFLQAIPAQRDNFTDEQKKAARHEAFQSMLRNGIVAVGDIANSSETLDLRALDDMHMHTFVECIGFNEQLAGASLARSMAVFDQYAAQQPGQQRLRQSLIPHAPYSVSGTLFRLINELAPGSLISIHNQESPAEDAFYRDKTGAVLQLLNGFGISYADFRPTGTSSLQSYLPFFSADHQLILVHNTCTTAADITFAQSNGRPVWWCLCPNANWYIERRLPDVPMLLQHTDHICIGTDSLASNHQLSVLEELRLLRQHFGLDWELLLRWGTLHGARALQLEDRIGSIAPGMQPGLVIIAGLDTAQPEIKVWG